MDLGFSGNVTLLFRQDLLAAGIISSVFMCAVLIVSVRRSYSSFLFIKKRGQGKELYVFLKTLNN